MSKNRLDWYTEAPEQQGALYDIYDRAFSPDAGEKWSRKGFAEILALDGILLGVANVDNRPAALVVVRTVLDEAEILTICVDPVHQGQGIARNMLGATIAQLARTFVRRIFLEVREGNGVALALYRAAGFVEDGRRRAYYSSREAGSNGRAEDALLLSLNISLA